MADPVIKALKIQTGVVKRLAKEKTVYEQEVVQQSAKIERMKNDGKDEYDIRKQEEVLQESKMMIPDCLKKLKDAHTKLSSVLEGAGDFESSEEYKAGQQALLDTLSLVQS